MLDTKTKSLTALLGEMRKQGLSARQQVAARKVIEMGGVIVMPEGVWKPETEEWFAKALAGFKGWVCYVEAATWKHSVEPVLKRKYGKRVDEHGKERPAGELELDEMWAVRKALMTKYKIPDDGSLPPWLKREDTPEAKAGRERNMRDDKNRREGTNIRMPKDKPPIAGSPGPKLLEEALNKPFKEKKPPRAPKADLTSKHIKLNKDWKGKRLPGSARTAQSLDAEAYLKKHPKATVGEVLEKTKLTEAVLGQNIKLGAWIVE